MQYQCCKMSVEWCSTYWNFCLLCINNGTYDLWVFYDILLLCNLFGFSSLITFNFCLNIFDNLGTCTRSDITNIYFRSHQCLSLKSDLNLWDFSTGFSKLSSTSSRANEKTYSLLNLICFWYKILTFTAYRIYLLYYK